MKWKAIGQSVIGTSHAANGILCEDSHEYTMLNHDEKGQTFIGVVCDGAGSARFGGEAAKITCSIAVNQFADLVISLKNVEESHVREVAENIFDKLNDLSKERDTQLNEFSCTFLGCILKPERSVFFQIGDGAIIRSDDLGYYSLLWWPDNGEYQNQTTFLVDDPSISNLKVKILEEPSDEVALFTDGLQLLALNTFDKTVHQPFFYPMFQALRTLKTDEEIGIVNGKLGDYLNSDGINLRTDDDKSLILVTRIPVDGNYL
ncbi:MAG TPA: PP2C family serine/threonine-protein phosphatase [Chitinophagaceae bacterium]|jgi:hypothetical protein|nr:PP2C family serine/threonine-protein phosphatase [Chitinophagaceae bacterium]